MSDNSEIKDKDSDQIIIPLRFRVPPQLPSFFSEHVSFNIRETGEIAITVFETIPLPVTDNREEHLKRLQAEGQPAEAQVRLTFSKSSFVRFIDAASRFIEDLNNNQETESKRN